jgi:hypothetical protein
VNSDHIKSAGPDLEWHTVYVIGCTVWYGYTKTCFWKYAHLYGNYSYYSGGKGCKLKHT